MSAQQARGSVQAYNSLGAQHQASPPGCSQCAWTGSITQCCTARCLRPSAALCRAQGSEQRGLVVLTVQSAHLEENAVPLAIEVCMVRMQILAVLAPAGSGHSFRDRHQRGRIREVRPGRICPVAAGRQRQHPVQGRSMVGARTQCPRTLKQALRVAVKQWRVVALTITQLCSATDVERTLDLRMSVCLLA